MSFKALLLGAVLAASLGAALPQRDVWSEDDLRVLQSLSLDSLSAPPADPSNQVADNPEAAEFGRLLFNDTGFSANRRVSCASCHNPAHGFTDHVPQARGVGTGTRRTMPIVPAVYSPWQFWDGRADSLWAQALGPIENPVEHGFTRTEFVARIGSHYAARYTRLFGPLPIIDGSPASPLGDAAARRRWAAMPLQQREAIDRVFVNAGKALAAFERRQRMPRTRFDAYVTWASSGSRTPSPLTQREVEGLRIFVGRGRCTTCHSGPLLTNNEFANTGVPVAHSGAEDRGRIDGIGRAIADPFNCRGRFSDDGERRCDELAFAVTGSAEQLRAYKVPSLRGVALRPPYMHAGQYRTLDGVVGHYSRAPGAPAGHSQLAPLNLTRAERRGLVAFLRTLNPIARQAR